MSDLSMYMTQPVRPLAATELRGTTVLTETARHTLKAAVHHELIRRMDLEKLAAIQADDVSGRQRIVTVLHQPPVDSPRAAVQAAIVQQSREGAEG